MKIFVINLEKDVARRESISQQLSNLGLDYEMISGVYGAALSKEVMARDYDDRRAILNRARSLVPAEIGCALSHIYVYREIVARGLEFALVLEDDVVLPADLGAFLPECEKLIVRGRSELWLLSPGDGVGSQPVRTLCGDRYRILKYRSGYFASSYIVTRSACEALLDEMYPVPDVADCWARISRYGNIDFYVVTPPLIVQNQSKFGSSTTADYWATYSGRDARYFVRRARSIVWDAIYSRYRRWCQ